MIKSRAIRVLCALLALTMLGGCVTFSIGGGGIGSVTGSGAMATFPVEVETFNAVSVGGNYRVIYRQAATSSLRVEIQENLFEHMQITVENGMLRVRSDVNFNTTAQNTPRLYVYTPYLESLSASGAVDASGWDTITAPTFSLSVSGAATVSIPVEVERLYASVSGSSNIALSGTADHADLRAAGVVNIEAGELQTKDARIDVSGAGSIIIACSDTLNVVVSGAASVRYIGDPEVTRRVSGAGSVSQAQR